MDILDGIREADRIREDAEAEYERNTATLVRLLRGSTLWQRTTGDVIPLQ